MTSERRKHQRVSKRFDGGWEGSSGGGLCTINDLSVGGCYVQTLSTPSKGDKTTVTVRVGEHDLTLRGVVVYVDPTMGFAVRFQEVTEAEHDQLRELLESLTPVARA